MKKILIIVGGVVAVAYAVGRFRAKKVFAAESELIAPSPLECFGQYGFDFAKLYDCVNVGKAGEAHFEGETISRNDDTVFDGPPG